MIVVARDYEGLKIAARELMEEARLDRDSRFPLRQAPFDYAQGPRATSRGQGPDPARAGRGATPDSRALADGYYTRVGYLLSLGRLKEFGIELRLSELDAAELHGLLALRAARAEFEREHPPCPQCGVPLETPFATWCSPCGWKKSGTGNR